MFDRIGTVAEKLATNVSRRAFLGRLGKGALGAAGVVAGVLAFPRIAQADQLNCYPGYYRCGKCCISVFQICTKALAHSC